MSRLPPNHEVILRGVAHPSGPTPSAKSGHGLVTPPPATFPRGRVYLGLESPLQRH
jgi:hypothetical protein